MCSICIMLFHPGVQNVHQSGRSRPWSSTQEKTVETVWGKGPQHSRTVQQQRNQRSTDGEMPSTQYDKVLKCIFEGISLSKLLFFCFFSFLRYNLMYFSLKICSWVIPLVCRWALISYIILIVSLNVTFVCIFNFVSLFPPA